MKFLGAHKASVQLSEKAVQVGAMQRTAELFADGAVRAAAFLKGKSAGLYGMKELLAEIL